MSGLIGTIGKCTKGKQDFTAIVEVMEVNFLVICCGKFVGSAGDILVGIIWKAFPKQESRRLVPSQPFPYTNAVFVH